MLPIIGVDIGQKRDPTAICVAEMESRQGSRRPEWHYLVRHLDVRDRMREFYFAIDSGDNLVIESR